MRFLIINNRSSKPLGLLLTRRVLAPASSEASVAAVAAASLQMRSAYQLLEHPPRGSALPLPAKLRAA